MNTKVLIGTLEHSERKNSVSDAKYWSGYRLSSLSKFSKAERFSKRNVVNDAVADVNVTGVTGGSLIGLIPFFYILLILGGAIGGGIAGFKG